MRHLHITLRPPKHPVIPAQPGIQDAGMPRPSVQQHDATILDSRLRGNEGFINRATAWIPAFAGMTAWQTAQHIARSTHHG